MGVSGGPNIIRDSSLVLELDAADRNSYPGSGTTWRDLTANNNSGSLVNGPTFSSANLGSIIFDGSNDYVNLGTFINQGTIDRTYSVWFKATSLPGAMGRIISFPNDDTSTDTPAFTLGILANGTLEAGIGGTPYNGYRANIPYTLNTWVNILATVVTKTMTLYLNSVSLGSNTSTGIVSSNPIGYLGRYNNQYGQYLTGQISSVQIYNRALLATEVLQNYNALKSRFNL
jgi:hypothetical protein